MVHLSGKKPPDPYIRWEQRWKTRQAVTGGLIGVFYDVDQDGILDCISTTEIQGTNNGSNGFFTFALWGDDSFTEHTDGLLDGQIPTFAILTNNNYVIAFEAVPDFEGYFANGFTTFNDIHEF